MVVTLLWKVLLQIASKAKKALSSLMIVIGAMPPDMLICSMVYNVSMKKLTIISIIAIRSYYILSSNFFEGVSFYE